MANDFEGLDDAAASVLHTQATQIRNNVLSTQNENPDTAAQYQHLAKFTNTPVESVYAEPDAVKQQAAMLQLDTGKLTSDYPHLSQFLTDQNNTAKSHDDIQPLAGVEGTAKALPPPAPGAMLPELDADAKPPQSGFSKWLSDNVDSLSDLPAALGKGVGASITQAERGVNLLVSSLPSAYDKAASLITGQNTTAATDAFYRMFINGLDVQASAFALSPNATTLEKVSHGAGSLLGTMAQIAATGGFSAAAAPALGAAEGASALAGTLGATAQAAKTMAFPAITGGVNTGHDVYAETGSLAQAVKASIASMGTTTAMGMLPMSLEGGLATRLATGVPVGMLTGEANRQLMNAALPTKMQAPANLEDAIVGGITGAMLAGALGGRGTSVIREGLQDAHDNGLKAEQSVSTMESLQALGVMSEQSKLRMRDPEAFHNFVQNISEDGHAPDIYVEAKALGDVLNQSGISLQDLALKMPDVAAQLKEGIETQGLIRIPVADYATHIAGSPLSDALLPHMKTDPDGMTYEEGQAYLQEQKATLDQQAQTLADKQLAQDTRDQQISAIGNDIKSQLDATGRFPESITKPYAAMHEAWYDTMSERMGMSPEELHQRFPLKIVDRGQGELAQGERGGFSPSDLSIHLMKDADLSTFLHESGHFYLEALHDMSKVESAPDNVKGDFDTLLQSFGVKGETPEERAAAWQNSDINGRRAGHEQFAEGFEKYLMDGKAPTPELQSMFSRFRSWLINVYRNFTGLGEQLSPEVKGVMDRMLASQDAIAAAEKTRNYAAMDLAGETGPDVEQYKALGQQATQDALAEMQTRSLRDMKWLSNAKSRSMKELQREARTERAKIKEQVTKAVEAEPVNRARQWLTKGETTDANGDEIKAQKGFKLDSEALKAMYPPGALGNPDLTGLRGMTSKDGLHPDLVAEMFGYNSAGDLIKDLTTAPKAADKIEGMTDQRMLEEHGELVDPVSIERAAEAAIHNEARAKMMATGLKILTKTPMSSTLLNKAAKEAADTAVAAKKIGELRPAQYSAAEAKANRELLKLAPKDTVGAAQAQRAALLNNRLFKSANEAVNDVRKGLVYLKRFNKDTVREKIDVDVRDQIDDLLARFDLRTNPSDKPTRAMENLEQWVESQRAAGFNPSISADMFKPNYRTPYRDMTVESFRGLVDSIKSMEHLGKERNTLMLDGEKLNLDDFVNNELVPKLKEHGQKFTTEQLYDRPVDIGASDLKIALDHFTSAMRGIHAQLTPQEFKRNAYDRHEILGPFGRAITEPVMQANYNKVRMMDALTKEFEAKGKELGRKWQDSRTDMVENNTLIDAIATKEAGEPKFLKITRGRMLGMAMHVGNESNFDKLVKGYGWKPEAVWAFLAKNMTAKDWDAVHTIWNLYEKHFPDMLAMYKRLGQTAPPKIEPRPFEMTLADGTVIKSPGGYAAIRYDSLRSKRGERDENARAIDPSHGLFGPDAYNRSTTTNGSMNARKDGYTDTIDLSYQTVVRSLQETIHDLAYREALINANKVLTQATFKKEFMKAYGREEYKSLQEWLGRIANQDNNDRATGQFKRLLQYTRTGLVMNAIALRVTTVLKHGGSAAFKTMGYLTGGGERYFTSRLASMTHDYKNQIESAIEKFPEIHARLLQQDRDYRATAANMFEPDSVRGRAERFGHAAVAWADMMTAVPTAWAAYDWAVTDGIPKKLGGTGKPMSEKDAVAFASKVVREAHGSNIESARSNIMTAPSEGLRFLTMIYGFMNNSYGQLADSVSKANNPGYGKTALMARTFMALVVPAIFAEAVTEGGFPDAENWAHFFAMSMLTETAGTLPLGRDALSMAKGFQSAGVVGPEAWLSTMVKGGKNAIKYAAGDTDRPPISAVFDTVGAGLHIPGLGQIGKSLQYISDVHTGDQPRPDTGTEYVKNALIGPPKLH